MIKKTKIIDSTPHIQSHHAYYLNNFFQDRDYDYHQKINSTNFFRRSIESLKNDIVKELRSTFQIANFNDHIYTNAKNYGIFLDSFVKGNVKDIISKRYFEIDKKERRELHTKMNNNFNLGKNTKIKDWLYIDLIFDTIFSSFLYQDFFDNSNLYNIIKDWFEPRKNELHCNICGNKYHIRNIDTSKYYGSNGFEFCCYNCQIMESPIKKDIPNLLKTFVENCGFIPTSNYNPFINHYSKRIVNSWDVVLRSYAKTGGIEHIKKKFGTFFLALAKSNILPEGTLLTGRGIKCVAKDGHECNSLDEQFIDNWLYKNNIQHTKEPFYPKHDLLNPKGLKRADWLINNEYYVEYFGLTGNTDYDIKTISKIQLTSDLKIKLIAIYPEDIKNIDELFKQKGLTIKINPTAVRWPAF